MRDETHILKTFDPYWQAVRRGEKRFEVRRDDRGFQTGDKLILVRTMPNADYRGEYLDGEYHTADENRADKLYMRVDWILTGGQFGVEPGYVVMSISPDED